MRRWVSNRLELLITSSVRIRPRKGATGANQLIDYPFFFWCEVSASEVTSSVARGAVFGIGVSNNGAPFEQVGAVAQTR